MAGPPQLTGEHRGEQAEWPAPSALRRALAFNSGKRKTKQNKAKWAGAGAGQGEKTPPNRSLHPEDPAELEPGMSRGGVSRSLAFRPHRAGAYVQGASGGLCAIPHKDHRGG